MSTPDSNQNEPSKMKKLLKGGDSDESPMSRLPRGAGANIPKVAAEPAPKKAEEKPKQPFTLFKSKPKSAPKVAAKQKAVSDSKPVFQTENKFLPTFWTITSVISMLVNIGVVIALIVVVQLLGGTSAALAFAQNQATGLLGGLHQNFVKMDAASIKTTIHVEKDIPVQFTLNVSGATNVTLSQDVRINGAVVTLPGFGNGITNERANIILPAGTVLPVFIENLVVPVDQKVPAVLDVPVDIPLNTTELHEPFVGLQKVVEPYYCLLQPNVIVNGVDVCANAAPLLPISP